VSNPPARLVKAYADESPCRARSKDVTTNEETNMSKVRFGLSMSLDGYAAGPEQSLENPLGVGGEHLHDWAFELAAWRAQHGLEGGEVNASAQVVEESVANVGAYLMGRKMFGGGSGAWDKRWRGWWGENPPFHVPVVVLSHHPPEPLELEGGTTFHFVTDGIEPALDRARGAAAGKDVVIAGGASVVQQYLRASLVDEANVSLVPIFLGGGERLFDNVGDPLPRLEQVRAIEAPGVTHLRYRLRNRS
jgi:dihydrofolate reductase